MVLPPYHATIEPAWIDYNGHVRDAYYTLAASYAVDAVMDVLGLDADYRQRTRGTLYALELHVHYLREIKQHDELTLISSVLDYDAKRMHIACRFECPRLGDEPAAIADFMLLHVRQGDTVRAAPFPEEVLAKLAACRQSSPADALFQPRSRAIAIKRAAGPQSA